MEHEKITMPLPDTFDMDEEGRILMDGLKGQEVTADEFLDSSFIEYCTFFPDIPPFLALKDFEAMCGWGKEICVTGLIDPNYVYLLDLYQDCENYSSLPIAGGVEDQNTLIMQAFRVLKSEANRFEKKRLEELDSKKK